MNWKEENKLNERRSLIPWGFWMDFPAFYTSLERRDSTENEEEQSNDLVMGNEMFRHSSSFGFNWLYLNTFYRESCVYLDKM